MLLSLQSLSFHTQWALLFEVRAIIICQLLQLAEKKQPRRQDGISCIHEDKTHPQESHTFLTVLLHSVSYMLIIWVSCLGPDNI